MLEFYVEGQSLRRGDRERLVAGSVGFVEFSLRFDPSWDGYTKTALFRNTAEEDTYCVFGVENGGRYALPHEVLKSGSEVEVCIFGAGENASCATVNSVRIPVEPTMAKGELKESLQPSPSLFEQLCSLLRDTLRKLPGKNLMLKADEETLWWKSREDELWEPLVSMDSLRGEDGTRWFSSEEAAQEAAEGDYLFSDGEDVFRREGGEWRLFAPLGSAVRRAEKAADEVRRLTESPNLFPEAFELWNGDGAIFAELGKEIVPSVMEPMATYRLPVTPGKSYAFTATPDGTPSLAVTDGDGICLEIKEESVDFLELPFRYGGAVPAYLYYVVRDLNDTGEVFFCEKGIGALEARLSEVEENRESLSNALKGAGEGSVLSFADVSPLEHTMKVKLKRKNLFDGGISPVLYENPDFKETAIASGVYQSFKRYLPKGTYTLSFGANVNLVRLFFNGLDNGNKLNVTSYTFTLYSDGYAGFSFRRNDEAVWAEGTEIQLEEGTKASAYAPYVEDLSSVSLKRCQKNRVPYPYRDTTATKNGITFTDNGDGTITANGTATAQAEFHLAYMDNPWPLPLEPNVPYTLSGCAKGGSEETYYLAYSASPTGSIKDYGNGSVERFDLAVSCYRFVIIIRSGVTVSDLVFKPQLEIGTTATDYEPYREPVSYTPNADGTVEGVKSLYPTTVLMSDTEGVVIEAEYNRDLNKAYLDLLGRVAALEGSV